MNKISYNNRRLRCEMKTLLCLTLCLFITFGIFSATEGQEVKTVDGIKIIKNGKKPKPLKGEPSKISFELDCVIGESDDPEKSFSEVSTFVVDDNEILYALDFKDRKIKVYDKEGKFIRSFGEQGQGPGELDMPAGIHLTPDNELLIEDATQRKLVYFTLEGTYLRHFSFADRLALVNLLMGPNGHFLGRELKLEGEKMFFVIKKFDPELKPQFSIDQIEFAIPIPGSGNKIDLMDMLSIYQFDGSGNIYYGRNIDYEIKVYTQDGTHVKSIQKEYDPQKVTEEDIEEILNRIPDVGPINVKELFNFPEKFPPYQYFTLDEEGRVFVRTWNKGKNYGEFITDVFDSEGRYITRFPSKMDIRAWKKGKAYSYEENEEGFKVIRAYNVLWEY
jgi:hypothetical protein